MPCLLNREAKLMKRGYANKEGAPRGLAFLS